MSIESFIFYPYIEEAKPETFQYQVNKVKSSVKTVDLNLATFLLPLNHDRVYFYKRFN